MSEAAAGFVIIAFGDSVAAMYTRANLLAAALITTPTGARRSVPSSHGPNGIVLAWRGGSGTVHKQLPQIAVTSLADAEKPGLTAGRVLSRHESGSEVVWKRDRA